MKTIINNLVKEISEKHAEILDNFAKTYIAIRWEDYFSKQKKIDLRRLELVIQQDTSATEKIVTTYFYRLRRGRLSKNIKNFKEI